MSEIQPETDAASGRRLVGCAGWSIPKEAAAPFPAAGSHLERYAAVLPAVEINSCFYRPHMPQTYARWAAGVPPGFRFCVKLPRTITHDARLRDPDEALDRFLMEAGELGGKLGCVLVQLPPSAVFESDVVADFLPRLRERFPCMLALEARHRTWFGDAATDLLREHGVTRVAADPPAGQPGPHVPTTQAVYLRLHGTPEVYYSRYEPAFLAEIAARIEAATARGADAWCIFDNTAAGAAVPNALETLQLLTRAGVPA